MKVFKSLLFMCFIILWTGCSKDFCDCFSGMGPVIQETRVTEPFSSIRLEDNVNIVLCRDTTCHVVVECGSGIIGNINTEVDAGCLRISNTSACNWVRDLDPQIKVYVYYTSLQELDYSSTGYVQNADTLKEKKFTLNVRDGAGSINLNVNIDSAWFNQHDGAADITLSGKVIAQYIYNNGLGPVNALRLKSIFTYVNNRGTNDCYVNVDQHLEARIEYYGNIYYVGNPPEILSWIEGKGKLLQYFP